jgi:hypothetical protein
MFIAFKREEVPFKCRVIIRKSTAGPSSIIDKGG